MVSVPRVGWRSRSHRSEIQVSCVGQLAALRLPAAQIVIFRSFMSMRAKPP